MKKLKIQLFVILLSIISFSHAMDSENEKADSDKRTKVKELKPIQAGFDTQTMPDANKNSVRMDSVYLKGDIDPNVSVVLPPKEMLITELERQQLELSRVSMLLNNPQYAQRLADERDYTNYLKHENETLKIKEKQQDHEYKKMQIELEKVKSQLKSQQAEKIETGMQTNPKRLFVRTKEQKERANDLGLIKLMHFDLRLNVAECQYAIRCMNSYFSITPSKDKKDDSEDKKNKKLHAYLGSLYGTKDQHHRDSLNEYEKVKIFEAFLDDYKDMRADDDYVKEYIAASDKTLLWPHSFLKFYGSQEEIEYIPLIEDKKEQIEAIEFLLRVIKTLRLEAEDYIFGD